MEKTIPASHLDRHHVGYVVNSEFSQQGKEPIVQLQQEFINRFGDAMYIPAPKQLHITLMDWLAPLVDYSRDKDEIFPEIETEYNSAIQDSLRNIGPINIHFNQISVNPDAIFIIGTDQGQYQKIRDAFVGKVTLLPNTKLPPKIIHSTIARFLEEIDLEQVRAFAAEQHLSFVERVDNFRLLRSTDSRMDNIKVLKRYYLN